MKRFHWPLQRLLMVTAQREQALRSDVFMLVQESASLRRRVMGRQALLRDTLAGLAKHSIAERMPRMEVFMKTSVCEERAIDALKTQLDELSARRQQKTEELMKARASRRTLERLRATAMQAHVRQQLLLEQKQFDESAQVAFARRAAGRKRSA